MKQKYISAALVLLILSGLARPALAAPDEYDTVPAGIVRLHIVANSDSAEDQRVKLMVRDALLACESDAMRSRVQSGPDAETALMQDAESMLLAAGAVLDANGADYGVRLALGSYTFPERIYAGKVYPAGAYRALRVVLGEGKGKNWWCVMFPPLCILELDTGEIDCEGMDDAELESFIISRLKEIDGGVLWKRIKECLR